MGGVVIQVRREKTKGKEGGEITETSGQIRGKKKKKGGGQEKRKNQKRETVLRTIHNDREGKKRKIPAAGGEKNPNH